MSETPKRGARVSGEDAIKGRVFECYTGEDHDTADTLDGEPLRDGERVRLRWPDGSVTEETVKLVEIDMPPTGWRDVIITPAYKRSIWLLPCDVRGISVNVRPALDPITVEQIHEEKADG